MGITVKIAGVDRTQYVDARSLSIIDELTSRVNSASFIFICNDIALAPIAGEAVLIEEDAVKLFSGRILTKEEDFLPPNLLKYQIECIDNTRDLDKKLVIESYLDTLAGNIIKDIISKYTSGFTTTNVADGPTITRIAFDYIQVSEAITKLAEACGYEWYIDYDKDIHFFFKTDFPAPFQLDDNQEHYKELIINTDTSQLRNRVYVKSSKYEILDFTELFVGDGSTVTWTCKYQANPLPHPSATLNGVVKTVGWDGVDNPDDYDFMINATTKVLSLGTYTSTPADGDEIVITYGADVPIIIRWDDQDSIDAVIAIEGGDGIFEHCITDNNIDTKEWAIDVAKADLLQNANPVIEGNFITNRSDIRSGQIITVSSTKRNISQSFLVQKVELVRVDTVSEEVPGAEVPFKPAVEAEIGFKPAAEAEIPFKPTTEIAIVIYYVYQVTIATKLKGLEDLLLQLLYWSSESLKRDTEAPDVPSGLALSTGIGEITQASLAWLKANWNANTEDDFSHYELKYKKTAYSDFGLVTTTNTSYIWTGLEQNIEYEVYIRAVDIYGNRSAWSSQQTQVTATDSEVPDQITGAVATPVLAGIKVTWEGATEGDIAGYIVERQESDNGTTWTLPWVEKTRINATMWLDLLLPYTKYYRYRISAYTQTGTEGSTSTPTADSINANKTGADDIVAKCITADQIFGNKLSVIFADMGTITAGTITLNTTGFIRSTGKVYGGATAGFWMGYTSGAYKLHIGTNTKYLMWDGANLSVKGSVIITGGSGIANLTDAGALATLDSIAYAAITGAKPPTNADHTADIVSDLAYYNMVSEAMLDSTIIIGGFIKTSLLTANNIRTGTLEAVQVKVGGTTTGDIYFRYSGIHLYDAGSNQLWFTKAGLASLGLYFSNGIRLYTSGNFVSLHAGSYIFSALNTGILKYPVLTAGAGSGPAGYKGYTAFRDYGDKCRLMIHDGSEWRYITNSSSNW